jgi:hypothetical protein
MNSKIAMCGLMALALAVGAGCKKKDDATATVDADAPPPAAPSATAPAPADTGTVASYPNMTPMGGTVRLLQPFTVHQAADLASPVLSSVGVGTFVNLKGSFSNWMLIEYPSGVGQLSPGWIELRSINDPRVTQAPRDAGLPVVVDAGRPAPPTGRPTIVIPPPPRKK